MFAVTMTLALVTLALGAAASGTFFTYSVSVIQGLDSTGPDTATAAMNGINVKILNPVFFAALIGFPIAAIVTAIVLLTQDATTPAILFFAAVGVYALTAIGPTAAVNVPLNNALGAAKDTAFWPTYAARWLAWNHLRTVGSLASVVLVGVGLHTWG